MLTENPVVIDPQGTIAGERMIFYRGEQNAEIEKPKVLLRALPNLGFRQEKGGPAAAVRREWEGARPRGTLRPALQTRGA